MRAFESDVRDFVYKHVLPVCLILSIVVFAMIYYFIDVFTDEKQFNTDKRENRFWDKLYFSLVTQSTVGYGDIYPVTALTKLFVSLQIFVTMVMAYYVGVYILSSSDKNNDARK